MPAVAFTHETARSHFGFDAAPAPPQPPATETSESASEPMLNISCDRTLPALAFESDATRKARMADAQRQRAQGSASLAWAGVPSDRHGWSNHALNHEDRASDGTGSDHPERVGTGARTGPCIAHLRLAPIRTAADRTRQSLDAAKAADRAGHWRDALRHYTTAVDGDCDEPHAHFRLAMLLQKTRGNLRMSLEHLRRASQLCPDNIEYRRALAELYETLGFTSSACAQHEEIRRLQGSVPSKRSWKFW